MKLSIILPVSGCHTVSPLVEKRGECGRTSRCGIVLRLKPWHLPCEALSNVSRTCSVPLERDPGVADDPSWVYLLLIWIEYNKVSVCTDVDYITDEVNTLYNLYYYKSLRWWSGDNLPIINQNIKWHNTGYSSLANPFLEKCI